MESLLPIVVDALNGSSLIEATLLLLLCTAPLVYPGASSATRHGLLALGLLGSLLLPLLAYTVPRWKVEVAGLEPRVAAASAPVEDGRESKKARVKKRVLRADAAGLELVPGEGDASVSAAAVARSPVTPAALSTGVVIWGGGTLFLLVRLFVGRRRIARLAATATEEPDPWMLGVLERCRRKMALSRSVDLRMGGAIGMPFVRGILRPQIALPRAARAWPRARLESVLLHELGHVRRLDEIFLVAGRAATAIYWFHPLVWRAERLARREGERACDDMVIALGTRPSEYASHLVDLVRALPGLPVPGPCALAAVNGGDGGELESRITAILSPSRRRRSSSGTGLVVSSALLALLLSPVASIELLAKPIPGNHEKSAYDRGMKLHQRERFDEAIAAFEESVARGERVADSTYNVGCGRALQGRADDAFAALSLAVDRGFADAELARRDDDLASLRSDPRFEQLLVRVAAANRRAAQEKLDALRRAGELDPGAWKDVGHELLAKRALPEALAALERAVELDAQRGEDDAIAIYNLACAHALSEHAPEALAALERAVEAGFDDPGHVQGDEDLASLRDEATFTAIVHRLEALEREEEAREAEEEAAEAREKAEERAALEARVTRGDAGGDLWYEAALARYADGDFAGAAEAFGKSAELHHRESTSAYNAACSHALGGSVDEAIAWLGRAAALGFDLAHAEEDTDLDSIRDDPRFRELVDDAAATHQRQPKLI